MFDFGIDWLYGILRSIGKISAICNKQLNIAVCKNLHICMSNLFHFYHVKNTFVWKKIRFCFHRSTINYESLANKFLFLISSCYFHALSQSTYIEQIKSCPYLACINIAKLLDNNYINTLDRWVIMIYASHVWGNTDI